MDRITKCILAAVAASAFGALTYTEAFAQPLQKCGPTNEILAEIRKTEQTEVAVGALTRQVIIVILASPGGAEWTQVFIGTDGEACINVRGTDWTGWPVVPGGEPA